MVNKKGWLRIVEASIAIMIIFGVLIVINSTQRFSEQQDLTRLIVPMLDEVARNVSLRENVVVGGENSVEQLRDFVSTRLKQSTIKYEVAVCESGEICSLQEYPSNAREIYAAERVISSTLNTFSPKKIKIFLWYETS
ncbi:MAG TPA: hypothetical protein VHA12_02965 [Candidatus Nanoarchaeia archaeon]|nr:hypothetical protein [Candidatus Nanoarchaeia archaeon]